MKSGINIGITGLVFCFVLLLFFDATKLFRLHSTTYRQKTNIQVRKVLTRNVKQNELKKRFFFFPKPYMYMYMGVIYCKT